MSETPTPKTLTETDVIATSERLAEPAWLRDRRLEAFKAFSDLEWPNMRDEDWRFTNPKRVKLDRPLTTAELTWSDAGSAIVASFVDAADNPVLREHLGTVVADDEVYAAFSMASFDNGLLVHIPADTQVAEPITITVEAADGTQVRRVLIVADRHAEATVILDQRGAADATVIDVVEAVIGDGATLNLVTQQHWGTGVAHVTTHRGKVGRDATYQQSEITLGGDTVYVRPDVWLAGKGSNAELLGAYFPTGTEKVEHRSLIFHDADHSTSDYVHKGALSDKGHATWYGNIKIDPNAKQTVSDETNRNLILSPGAKADTLPFLEIETADVAACGHHSSVGQVDEVQLWYLQSRGIARDDAARMLVFAFFAEVLERINAPGIAETVMADIEQSILAAPATLMDPRRSASDRHDAETAAGKADSAAGKADSAAGKAGTS